MAEQQNWLASRSGGEIDLQTVAEVGAAMELRASAQSLEPGRDVGGNAADGRLVVAGRFDFDEIANRVDDLVLMFREISQAIGPCWAESELPLTSLLSCRAQFLSLAGGGAAP